MDIYLEADKKLAELLGWTNITHYAIAPNALLGTPSSEDSLTGVAEGTMKIPRWTQDNEEAFRLMVEHKISINQYSTHVQPTFDVVNGVSGIEDCYCYHRWHTDKITAIRYAIVQAVIAKLESAQ